jgi:hypothetical protein
MDEGVTDERPVRACKYVPKALYSGGESYMDKVLSEVYLVMEAYRRSM